MAQLGGRIDHYSDEREGITGKDAENGAAGRDLSSLATRCIGSVKTS